MSTYKLPKLLLLSRNSVVEICVDDVNRTRKISRKCQKRKIYEANNQQS